MPEQSGMPWAPPQERHVEQLPYDHRKRGAMQRRLLESGRHPLTGLPVRRLGAGEREVATCGSCTHLVRRGGAIAFGRAGYPKCERNETDDVRSDVTLSWPGCHEYEPKETPL